MGIDPLVPESRRYPACTASATACALNARAWKAVADPKRLLIINELRNGPRSVGEIARRLGLSQPNTSQHLAILRDRRILTTSRAGSTVYYSLRNPKVLAAIDLVRELIVESPVASAGFTGRSRAGEQAGSFGPVGQWSPRATIDT